MNLNKFLNDLYDLRGIGIGSLLIYYVLEEFTSDMWWRIPARCLGILLVGVVTCLFKQLK